MNKNIEGIKPRITNELYQDWYDYKSKEVNGYLVALQILLFCSLIGGASYLITTWLTS